MPALRVQITQVKRVYQRSKGKVPIIGVGGISSAEDAYRKVRAGASLVQVYTGLVYEGPELLDSISQVRTRMNNNE